MTMHSTRDALHAEIASLRALIDTKAETIRQLREEQCGGEFRYPAAWCVRGQQRTILRALHLSRMGFVSRERLHSLLYDGREAETDIKIIDQQICKLRKKVTPHGIIIGNEWGGGYFISADVRRILDAACEAAR